MFRCLRHAIYIRGWSLLGPRCSSCSRRFSKSSGRASSKPARKSRSAVCSNSSSRTTSGLGRKRGMTFYAAGTCISRITSPTSARANSAATTLTTISFSGSGRRHREASINRELAVIARMMHLGERTTPPRVRGVPHFPKVKESEPRTGFLEQPEYDKLRLHAHELWLRALLATYYTFGFRRSELLRLRVRQINLIDRTINLPAGATKNGKARTVVMTAEVLALVTALIHGKQPDDFVFTHDDGTPVKDFRGAWAKMFADAGVEMRKLHDMRRSAVRNAILRGVDRDTVKKMSGHLTDDVFSRYNIQAVDDLEDAARRIEEGAARTRATDTKTDISENAPSESGQMLQ